MSESQTIIAVPINFDNIGQLRQFLVQLVIRLDVLLGLRGGDENSFKVLVDKVAELEARIVVLETPP